MRALGCARPSENPIGVTNRTTYELFPPHLSRALVGAQTEKRRMPQPTLGRSLHEPYLGHQLRPHPLHLPHLGSRHAAAPTGCLRVRQIDEGTLIDLVGLQRLEDLAAQVRNEASSHLACEPQAAPIVVADVSVANFGSGSDG
jgi:hypothetical protein